MPDEDFDINELETPEEDVPDPNEPSDVTPGEIMAELLESLGEVDGHGETPVTNWPVFKEDMPDYDGVSENLVACSTTTPINDGHSMTSGRTVMKHGVQIRVRANKDRTAYTKAMMIIQALYGANNTSISIKGTSYDVHHCRLDSGPIRAGRNDENRFDYTLNYLMSVTTP